MKQMKTLIRKIGRDRLAILLIGGLLILIISIPTDSLVSRNGKTQDSSNKGTTGTGRQTSYETTGGKQSIVSGTDYAAYLEKKLQNVLQTIDGAGQVYVMITLRDAGGCVIEKNIAYERENETRKNSDGTTQTSTSSSDSEETVYTVDENGNSIPLISKQILPSVEGILIVAEGGDRADVKSEMKQAVLSLFNLDEHKISIVKMKGKTG